MNWGTGRRYGYGVQVRVWGAGTGAGTVAGAFAEYRVHGYGAGVRCVGTEQVHNCTRFGMQHTLGQVGNSKESKPAATTIPFLDLLSAESAVMGSWQLRTVHWAGRV